MASQTMINRLGAGGIVSPTSCVAEAQRAALPLHLAAALLEKESGGGRNVFGHDRDRNGEYIFPAHAGTVKVTRKLYEEYKARRIASGNQLMLGVGPCQLTWWELQDRADSLGGCWRPEINVRVGFTRLAELIEAHGEAGGVRRYNGTGPAAEAYSADVLKRAAAWRERLEGLESAPTAFAGTEQIGPAPLAGYTADSLAGADLLGLRAEVRALCAVVSAKSVVPPLSIGLFGPWGSGKSFYMKLMRTEIARLASRSAEAREAGREDPFCEHVVQIEFNAWHYLDANLWAALMARIWEQLAVGGDGARDAPDDRYKELFKRLETSSALVRAAERDAHDAKQRAAEARKEIDRLARERDRMSSDLGALTGSDLASQVADDASVRNAIAAVEREAGLREGSFGLTELRTLAGDLRGLGRVRAIWTILRRRRAWRRVLVVVAVLLLALGLALVAAHEWVVSLAVTATAVLGVAAAAGRAVMTVVRPASSLLDAIDAALQRAREAEEERQAEIAERRITLLTLDEEAAARRSNLTAAHERKRDAERALAEIESGRAVPRFIEERAASADYSRHRGLIAQIQRDLETLSTLMRTPESRTGVESTDDEQLPQIDRIVLYIDDLDRCPARLVVEVLQAVHLLLAYPLFVVVVGVDPRWLESALSRHHKALLGSETALSAEHDGAGDWTATPQEYLEKIFQLPLILRPMEQHGYHRLVHELLPAPTAPEATDDAAAGRRAAGPAVEGTSGSGGVQPDAADEDEFEPGHPNLEIEPEEIEFVERLWPLMPNPRAVKRLSNVYRFIRAQVTPAALPVFTGRAGSGPAPAGEYQAVLLLLAVLIGRPHDAPAVLAAVISPGNQRWGEMMHDIDGVSDGSLSALRTASEGLDDYPLARVRDWVPVVARFSFSFWKLPEAAQHPPAGVGADA